MGTRRSKPDVEAKAFPLDAEGLPALRQALVTWFRRHQRDLPWRRRRDAYAVLVSELMLQQTQVKTVVPYFERWMTEFPTWSALAAAPESRVLKAWEGLGYYQRARHLHAAARAVMERHGGELPADLASIRSLPGVGPYTAGAVASLAFGLPEPLLDGNVMRVLTRLANEPGPVDQGETQRLLWAWAGELLDRERPGPFNEALMELGATVCVKGEPFCLMCPVQPWCRARNPADLPRRAPRPERIEVTQDVGLFVNNGRVHLYRDELGPRWKGLWRFPDAHGVRGKPLHELTHAITRYQVTLRLFAVPRCPRDVKPFLPHEVESIPMPAPHRKLFDWWRAQRR